MADTASNTPEERLVKRVIARFRCSHCNRQHLAQNVNVMGKYDAVWIVGVDCDQCHRAGMFVVSLRKDSSFERVTDLTDEEQERFLARASVDAGDVEGIRAFLQDFKGDFSQLFGEA
ncbi:MAG: hypothetical protein JOZ39_07590 [Chloroflexi bacterium]|nr:hypothetical protein [Chloroflexota bacterium]